MIDKHIPHEAKKIIIRKEKVCLEIGPKQEREIIANCCNTKL